MLLIWVIIFFIFWYGFVVVLIIPKYYKVLRSCVENLICNYVNNVKGINI